MAKAPYAVMMIALLAAVIWAKQTATLVRSKALVLNRADFKLTPAAITFDEKGDLYVGYRDKGVGKKSSAIWLRVFDPASGKELLSAQVKTSTVPLPNGAEQFLLSPDNSLLLYSQFHGSMLIATFNAKTLQRVSVAVNLPMGVNKEFPRVIGIDSSNSTVTMSGEITNHLNGVDVRLIKLEARDLDHVQSDKTISNPIPESGYAVDNSGAVWIIRANGLYRYDASKNKANLVASIHNNDDIGGVAFLKDRWLIMWSHVNQFGYLYRFKQSSSKPDASQRVQGCGVGRVYLSPDQQYGTALCEHERTTEWRFGAITTRNAVVFDTRTLKILAEIPIAKNLYPELAIWHGDGRIALVTQGGSNRLLIYEIPLPKRAS
jgi:hypothetical protein